MAEHALMEKTMHTDRDLDRLAEDRNARLAEAANHRQNANQIRAEFYVEIVQHWHDKLQRLGDVKLTRWINAAG